MSRRLWPLAWALVACFVVAGEDLKTASGPHGYFNTLVSRADHWRSYSLREADQIAAYIKGTSPSMPARVTYSPATDSHPMSQDAAKVIIKTWDVERTTATIRSDIDASATQIHYDHRGAWDPKTWFRIDDEIVRYVANDRTSQVLTVDRGLLGTTAKPHAAGSRLVRAGTDLTTPVWLPLGTTDGHSYFFTWDAYYTDSYLPSQTGLKNHKAYQFASDGIWLETQTLFGGGTPLAEGFDPRTDIAVLRARSYNKVGGGADWLVTDGSYLGPGVTDNTPIMPFINDFIMKPNTWTRWFWLIEQRANDYDYASMWVADENRDAVQVYGRIPLSVRPGSGAIDSFWLEFDTSTKNVLLSRNRPDMVAYVRNFVALRDPVNVSGLLTRPLGGPPLARQLGRPPSAPDSVRILPGLSSVP